MNQAYAITNCRVYSGDTVYNGHAVCIAGGNIIGIPPENALPAGWERVDLGGQTVAPGFIDVQCNGGGGVLFNDEGTAASLRVIAAAHERFGTLHWCPTVITAGLEATERCLRAVGTVMEEDIGVLGAHLEGPYLSPKRPGVHETGCIRPATESEIAFLLAAGPVALVTLAPETMETERLRQFTEAGVRVFLGHSDTSCETALAAFGAGASGVTHLYNAMSPLAGREPGLVGASFLHRESWAGIIADGIHVDWRAIRLAKECKQSRLFLVTDAMPPVGKPDAVYSIGGREVRCHDGRCATGDGTLAGSALDMASAVRNCVRHCGISLGEALRMASAYPAEMLGVDDRLGYIRPGYYADLVVLNEDTEVTAILRRGIMKQYGG